MDAGHFLRERLAFVRFYYETSRDAFCRIQLAIEEGQAPFDNPPHDEDGEPAFLAEWMDAKTGTDVLGLSCVAMISDSLKLYLDTIQHRVIRFVFDAAEKKALKRGFLAGHLAALGSILDTDWKECPADLAVIEQIVLSRNLAAHGSDLTSLRPIHDRASLAKHPRPFFVNEDEWAWSGRDPEALSAPMRPTLDVDRDRLNSALDEIGRLVSFIESRLDRVVDWRERMRAQDDPSRIVSSSAD